jgi:transposase-like protein
MATKYSEAFKSEALALAGETSVSNAGAKLGVSTKTIYG